MRLDRKRRLAISVMACTLVLGGSATATEVPRDNPGYIVSVAAGTYYGYATPVMVIEPGGELSYSNFDIVQHDVVHDVSTDGIANKKKDKWCRGFRKGECPLFWSARAGLGDTVAVQGTKNLKSGTIYSFLCTLHPGMKGKLVVR
ncbi:MAG: cupredoxin domain-containing protein [Actinomycetota bacterium]